MSRHGANGQQPQRGGCLLFFLSRHQMYLFVFVRNLCRVILLHSPHDTLNSVLGMRLQKNLSSDHPLSLGSACLFLLFLSSLFLSSLFLSLLLLSLSSLFCDTWSVRFMLALALVPHDGQYGFRSIFVSLLTIHAFSLLT